MKGKRSWGTKGKQQYLHFKKRCLNRIGFELSKTTYDELIKCIQSDDPDPEIKERYNLEFIQKQSNRVSEYRITVLNKKYRIVYDKKTKRIVTILW